MLEQSKNVFKNNFVVEKCFKISFLFAGSNSIPTERLILR
jgi:hypothetical protein